jgi:hypothetical protein
LVSDAQILLTAPARTWLQEAIPGISWSPPAAASVGAGLLVLAGLFWLADGRAGAWSWRKTGLWVGVVAALAWPASSATGRDFGLAVVPGSTGLLSALAGQAFPAWDVLLVLGVPAAGWQPGRPARSRSALRARPPSLSASPAASGSGSARPLRADAPWARASRASPSSRPAVSS